MLATSQPVLPMAYAVVAVVALFSLPALATIRAQWQSRMPKDHFYEDEDGCATPESLVAFSNRKHKAAILLFSAVGAGSAVANLVFSCLLQDEFVWGSGLHIVTWVRVCIRFVDLMLSL